ncbi:GtrA family protein [Thalassospira xiamenensis]|uniref:GtrA family protein n=1 Tax=Thalassospira xiamenensis TaxID=220697 RepID=UPI003AA86CBA
MTSISKFIGVGALTTLVSYSTYLLALQILAPMLAYICALIASFIIQIGMMAPFVFKAKLTIRNAATAALIYAGYSTIFAVLMWFALKLDVPPVLAPFIVIIIASPLHFLAGKKWIHNPADDIRM